MPWLGEITLPIAYRLCHWKCLGEIEDQMNVIRHQHAHPAEPNFLFIPLLNGFEDGWADFRMTKCVLRPFPCADGYKVGFARDESNSASRGRNACASPILSAEREDRKAFRSFHSLRHRADGGYRVRRGTQSSRQPLPLRNRSTRQSSARFSSRRFHASRSGL
jgi:hypothetical protein